MDGLGSLLQCLSGKTNPEARNGRLFFLFLYVALNLSLGIHWFAEFNDKILSGESKMTTWVPWAKFFGVMMDLNFTLIFVPISRVAVIGKAYRIATNDRSAGEKGKDGGGTCWNRMFNFIPLDYAIEFHMMCGYMGYACAILHTFCHIMNYNARAAFVWADYGISIWITGVISLVVLTLLVAAAHNNIRRQYFAIFWGAHTLGFSTVTLMNLVHSKSFFGEIMGPNNWEMSNTERAVWGIVVTSCAIVGTVLGTLHCKRAKLYKKYSMGWVFWGVILGVWGLAFFNVLASKFGQEGSRYWIFFAIFVLPFYSYERFVHNKQWGTPVTLHNFTLMGDKVLTLSLGKEGFPNNYKEGEYAYLYCPTVSWTEKHPFTICSAPFEPHVQFSIRVSDSKASWTRRVRDYLKQFNPSRQSAFCELFSNAKDGVQRGKLIGPNGKPFFMIYGPCSAPTTHIGQYDEVMICASGIGVTPLASTMKSIVFDRWPNGMGRCFPDRARFYWVCSHRDVDNFRWFIRTIKEADDQVNNYLRTNNDFGPKGKLFEVHIFITSYRQPAETKVANLPDQENDEAFWGRRRAIDASTTKYGKVMRSVEASYTEWDLYNAINHPDQNGASFGQQGRERVHVHFGRPKWDTYFEAVKRESPYNKVGVTFCGHPMIGSSIEKACAKYTSLSRGGMKFALHSEVF